MTPETVLTAVCEECRVDRDALAGPSRIRILSDARKIYCYLLQKHTRLSGATIGPTINRHFSTINWATKSAEQLIPRDRTFQRMMAAVALKLGVTLA